MITYYNGNINSIVMNSARNERTGDYIQIVNVWDKAPDIKDLQMIANELEMTDRDIRHLVTFMYNGKYFLLHLDGQYTSGEIISAIRSGYRPDVPFRNESVYVNRLKMNMVDAKDFYHRLVKAYGRMGVDVILTSNDLFSRAYVNALMERSCGENWCLPTASRIFEILEILKSRKPHVEGVLDT